MEGSWCHREVFGVKSNAEKKGIDVPMAVSSSQAHKANTRLSYPSHTFNLGDFIACFIHFVSQIQG